MTIRSEVAQGSRPGARMGCAMADFAMSACVPGGDPRREDWVPDEFANELGAPAPGLASLPEGGG